jgi:hypothetical protein
VNKEYPVHASGPGGLVVRDRVGVEPHLANRSRRTGVVCGTDGIGQEELGLTLAGVNLNREHHGWSDQDSAFPWLGNDECALLDAVAAAKRSRDDDGPPLADPTRLGRDRPVRNRSNLLDGSVASQRAEVTRVSIAQLSL